MGSRAVRETYGFRDGVVGPSIRSAGEEVMDECDGGEPRYCVGAGKGPQNPPIDTGRDD